jgi:hypothetical protein
MFEFVRRQRLSMLDFLDQYLDMPEFDHAVDIVPLIAAAPCPAWPLWSDAALCDAGMQDHLLRSLSRWSAFRGAASFSKSWTAFRENLPRFILDFQRIPEARLHLSEIPENQIETLANSVETRLIRFGRAVKGNDSAVLPSKTAHLLIPSLIPAYDNGVIKNSTLCRCCALPCPSYPSRCPSISDPSRRKRAAQVRNAKKNGTR